MKEELFERMFSRETMVFSRSDRIQIIENIDKITDKIEIVARKLLLHQVKIPDYLKDGMKEISEINCQIGDKTVAMVINVLDEFDKVKSSVKEITDLRRIVKDKHWELQKLNYQQEDFIAFRYTETLIKYLMEAADRAEIFADRIFILIHKYGY